MAIVGNSGGPGILATDACDGAGLEVPELSAATQAAFRAVVDPNAAGSNPVDLVASATPEVYEQALRIVLADDSVDAAIAICTPTFAAPPPEIADVLRRSSTATNKPLLGCFLAWPDLLAENLENRTVPRSPAFASPEPAAQALARAASYAAWRTRSPGAVPDLDSDDVDRARSLVEAFLIRVPEGGWLPAEVVDDLLSVVGVRTVTSEAVGNAAGATRAAARLGIPVALKHPGLNWYTSPTWAACASACVPRTR